MTFRWDEKKNKQLKSKGRPGFELFVTAFEDGHVYFEGENKNYPGQGIFVVIIEDRAHVVPFEDRGDHVWLATLYPSGKWTAIYEEDA